jgi:hypothetical protein
LGWDHKVGSCGFSGRCFDTRGCFLLCFSATGKRGCCGFALSLLRSGRLPDGRHFGLRRRFGDRQRKGIWIRGEVVVSLTTCPLGQRVSATRPSPSGKQRSRPSGLSERQGGLWRRSFGHDRAPSLQEPPSLLSTSHSSGSPPCGLHRMHSTGSVPAG